MYDSDDDDDGDTITPPLQERAFMNLLIRIHDLYIASPNCTQPGFSHTQGHSSPIIHCTQVLGGRHCCVLQGACT